MNLSEHFIRLGDEETLTSNATVNMAGHVFQSNHAVAMQYVHGDKSYVWR